MGLDQRVDAKVLYKLILFPKNETLTARSFQLLKAHHEQNPDADNTPTGDQKFVYEGGW